MALRAADPAWQAYVQFESKDRSACGPAIPRLLRQGRNRAFRANLMEQDHVASDDSQATRQCRCPATRRAGTRCSAAIARRTARSSIPCARPASIAGRRARHACPGARTSRFHQTCADAERAGFRPCKRCRPNEPARADRQAAAVATACRLIEAAEEVPSLDVLARAADMSRFHFHRVFKAVTGVTPKAYAAAHRGNRVREELAARDTVTQAIYGAGFNSGSRFYAASSGLLGMTPTEFRAGGSGNVIRFAVGECSLGAVLVARDGQGRLRHRPRRRSRRGWCAVCRTVFRTRGWSAATRPSSNSSPRWWASSMPRRKVSIFRSTFAAPRSSGGYGTPSAASRRDRPRAIARSLGGSARRRRCARWRRRARRTRSRLPFRVIGWCARTDSSRATAGALHASAPCWRGRRGHDPRADSRTRAAPAACGALAGQPDRGDRLGADCREPRCAGLRHDRAAVDRRAMRRAGAELRRPTRRFAAAW